MIDLSKAVSELVDVLQVPLLQDAGTVALSILKNVQVHRNNTAKLQQLALTIVDQLTGLSDLLSDRRDGAPDGLKEKLDVFVGILKTIQKLVEDQAKTPSLLSFLTASDRDTTIGDLDTRLKYACNDIQMFLTMNIATVVDRLKGMVDASHANSIYTSFVLQELQVKLNESRAQTSYCRRSDFYLRRAIMRNSITMGSGGEVTIVLREATRQMSGETVLIKAYEGDAPSKRELFMDDLRHAQKTGRDPAFLPVTGYSSAEVSIPFQVYESPDPAARDEASLKGLYEQLVRSHAAATSMSLRGEETLALYCA